MDLSPYAEHLRGELAAAAGVGGDEVRALADQLLPALDAAVRLTLLEALSAAAEEISAELAPGSVDVRLRARSAEFVVTPPPPGPEVDGAPAGVTDVRLPDDDDATTVRINLRLPDSLKARIEEAATRGGLSINTWLVRAAAAALVAESRPSTAVGDRPGRTVGQHYTGWAR